MLRSGRGLATIILASVAVVFALRWAQSLVIFLVLGVLFAYTLNPLVAWLERIRIHRVAGAMIVMVSVVCTLGIGAYSLRGQIQTILDQLPDVASEIEKATRQATGEVTAPRQPVTRVVIDPPGFKLGNSLWANSMGVAAFIGQATMVLFLTFFLLLSGDTYKRKLVRLTRPSLSSKKVTVHILDDINESIQRYMFMLFATNVLVGLLTWIALSWGDLENAGAWAVAAGLLHAVPYFGPAVTAAGIGMAAFMQFDSLAAALAAAGISVVIATLVGTFVTTWMTGRMARMNATAVFISLLFWTWLWGFWGILLGIPLTVILKVVAEQVEQLEPVAELLGQ